MTFDPDDECNQYFTSSDEDLIKRILAEGQLQLCDAQQLFSQPDSDLADLSSILGDKTEVILLQKLSDPLTPGGGRRNPPKTKTAFTSNTVITDVCRPEAVPCLVWPCHPMGELGGACPGQWAVYVGGARFQRGRGHDVADFLYRQLPDFPVSYWSQLRWCVRRCTLRCVRGVCVRRSRMCWWTLPGCSAWCRGCPEFAPPTGFALAQAQDQARKVRLLHTMLKNFLVYMLVLLVVLLLNFSDPAEHSQTLGLHTQLKHTLHTPETVSRREDLWAWLTESLLPRLLDDSSLFQETGSVLLGLPQLRQTRDTHSSGSVGSGSINGTSAAAWTNDVRGGEIVQSLSRTLDEAVTSLRHLQQRHWLDHRTREVCVEFSLYNTNTDLLTAFNFLFEFPVSEHAQSSLDLLTFRLQPITGLNLQLLLTGLFLLLLLYFCVGGATCCFRGTLREGWRFLLSPWRLLGACGLVLAACVCVLQFLRLAIGGRRWAQFLADRSVFTDFHSLARLSHAHSNLSALLLFLLLLKASHHLRLLREWAVFGRALSRSVWDVLAAALLLLLLLLAYAHTAHLLFHAVLEGYGNIGSACLSLLGAGGRGLLSWRPSAMMTGPLSSTSSLAFHSSFAVLRLLLLWMLTSALLRNYRRARAELYRPAVDLQDYEMVELFLRRLKMWMGLSRAKEFRHKVRFEAWSLPRPALPPPATVSPCACPPWTPPTPPPSPDSVDAGSEASWRPSSSSPCFLTEAPGTGLGLGLGPGPGGLVLGGPGGVGGPGSGSPGGLGGPGVPVGGATWRERAESEATLRRLLPSLDALLQQLDRVTVATEELYRVECRLERAQRKARERGRGLGRGGGGEERGSASAPPDTPAPLASMPKLTPAPPTTPAPVPTPSLPPTPAPSTPVPPLVSTPAPLPPPQPRDWNPPLERETLPPSSSLFNYPAHTTTIPTHKRKRKPPPLKNKVHPNPDRHVSGHPKP
ncbi:polycystin-1-like [Osmerus mordax]|uniref:polycystin-1-like n=1 Tax=Osmerus mordax TaxID=8014 RepID=UPI0035106A75